MSEVTANYVVCGCHFLVVIRQVITGDGRESKPSRFGASGLDLPVNTFLIKSKILSLKLGIVP